MMNFITDLQCWSGSHTKNNKKIESNRFTTNNFKCYLHILSLFVSMGQLHRALSTWSFCHRYAFLPAGHILIQFMPLLKL
jgi:hypothetical protein